MNLPEKQIHRHTKLTVLNYLILALIGSTWISLFRSLLLENVISIRYVLTCIDRTTKWIEAEPFAGITNISVANVFVHAWITLCGVPLHVLTHRATLL